MLNVEIGLLGFVVQLTLIFLVLKVPVLLGAFTDRSMSALNEVESNIVFLKYLFWLSYMTAESVGSAMNSCRDPQCLCIMSFFLLSSFSTGVMSRRRRASAASFATCLFVLW